MFHESYGQITQALMRLIKKYNVSPSDFQELEYKYGEGNLAAIGAAIKQYSKDGQFQVFLMWKDR